MHTNIICNKIKKHMIDGRDFKIGNIVYINNIEHHKNLIEIPLSITGISSCVGLRGEKTYGLNLEHICKKQNEYYETYSQLIQYIKPIEIKDCWLLKFGFKKVNDCTYKKGDISIYFLDCDYCVCLSGVYFIPDIKYIHQVQNIFHVIDGGFLEIK